MTHKLKTEMFSQKIEYSGGVFFWSLTPLFSFVSFHLKSHNHNIKSYAITKYSLSCFDNKRYILEDGITTLAYGHYKTK